MRTRLSSFKSPIVWAGLLAVGAFGIILARMGSAVVVERPVGAPDLLDGAYNKEVWWVPVRSLDLKHTGDHFLETMVYRPSGTGPFALAIIDHGKPSPGADVSDVRPGFEIAARWFVDYGFAVAVPTRRGYGRSQGAVSDLVGSCDTMDYFETAKRTALDAKGVISFMQQQNFIDPKRIIMVGHSHGGLGALGLATDPPDGVIGVINFAGGSGAWGRRNQFCNGRENLIAAMRNLGSQNKVPQIWLYALDDRTFDPSIAREMWQAVCSSSQHKIEFVTLPPGTGSGHMLFANGNASVWELAVQQFLKQVSASPVSEQNGSTRVMNCTLRSGG